ncbi:MAG: SDR family NAD(P)-dependent oxidoreductase [Acidobacteria bacterium]|nr:SDR family NAD(P)-dependent oxidoreductase [Acidobacteriota bacterium]NIM60841.1 SDR family NAD(P)-dependent oxidoreductase [Acidobacteriota bacterium]NIO58689.1 SDR family NAD(P)-dependent oxidoreductase [Acidobacteriota bacterium]NIQ29745.1 SDR family NAD(P)-dependent oxidoreductase [Acidobacteriota bacterium]NIQ87029.1 SDR family NAD(P)-dependent oxidoreductase [Acidobacteriota bacterium]
MTRIKGKTVLITGGAAGMGKLIARRCHGEQAGRLVLWDIDERALHATAEELRAAGASVSTTVVDVSSHEAIAAAARETLDRDGPVELLFNNAGVVVGKRFDLHSTAEIERSVRVNVLGAMHVARAFLPAMIERRAGHVVNIASAVALTPHPNMSVYTASKWAVLGWSESLRLELESLGAGLRVTTVCPGYIDTGMFAGAKAPLFAPILKPDAAVDRIIRAVQAGRILVRMPHIVHTLPLLRGLLPTRVFDRLVGRGFGVYRSMDDFIGKAGES